MFFVLYPSALLPRFPPVQVAPRNLVYISLVIRCDDSRVDVGQTARVRRPYVSTAAFLTFMAARSYLNLKRVAAG